MFSKSIINFALPAALSVFAIVPLGAQVVSPLTARGYTVLPVPQKVTLEPAKIELRRHKRKYAAGQLGEDKSFYFRGPQGKLNIRAQNLNLFAQIAEGVDEDTWVYHLKQNDYSEWLREAVKDDAVADEIAMVERNTKLLPAESRARILETIRKHYTGPA